MYALPFLLSSKFFNSVFLQQIKNKNLFLTLGLISLILNLVLNYVFIFIYDMGHVGLALATTFTAVSVWAQCNNISI